MNDRIGPWLIWSSLTLLLLSMAHAAYHHHRLTEVFVRLAIAGVE